MRGAKARHLDELLRAAARGGEHHSPARILRDLERRAVHRPTLAIVEALRADPLDARAARELLEVVRDVPPGDVVIDRAWELATLVVEQQQ